MRTYFARWLAVALILEIGLIHILNAQAEYEEAAYMGYLFVANFVLALLAALAIARGLRPGWMAGILVAGGSIAGYALSRTLGMPQMNVEEWFSPYGVVSQALEGGFLLLASTRPWQSEPESPLPPTGRLIPLSSLALVALVGGVTFGWNTEFLRSGGHHVGSLEQVCRTQALSAADLEEKYGVRISRVATSMVGSIVDVRILIVDPDKAHNFLLNQAALLVNNQTLILAPHLHSHTGTRLKAGKVFTIFFPTQQVIQTGSSVSLVFGPTRLEATVVQ